MISVSLLTAFSQAIAVDRTVYVSGQLGLLPEVGRLAKIYFRSGDIIVDF